MHILRNMTKLCQGVASTPKGIGEYLSLPPKTPSSRAKFYCLWSKKEQIAKLVLLLALQLHGQYEVEESVEIVRP